MNEKLTSIKDYLGKYYSEILYSAAQDKYLETQLDNFFEQRFQVQNNQYQIIINPDEQGLTIDVSGNEIVISKSLHDHPSITVTNSNNNPFQGNPRALYNPEIFPTIAYLICQNHTIFQINGEVDEPIYVRYKGDYENFYNSILIFNIDQNIDVEIVEEIASVCALNSVINYIVQPNAKLSLSTFYQNHISALSFFYRNIILQDSSSYIHILFGKESSNVIDENKIISENNTKIELYGIVDSRDKHFHSILQFLPSDNNYSMNVDYRNIISEYSDITFYPLISGRINAESSRISVTEILKSDDDNIKKQIHDFIMDIVERAALDRMEGVKRFYDNKQLFLDTF